MGVGNLTKKTLTRSGLPSTYTNGGGSLVKTHESDTTVHGYQKRKTLIRHKV